MVQGVHGPGGVHGPAGGAWSREGLVETPRWLLLQSVSILLECILFLLFDEFSKRCMKNLGLETPKSPISRTSTCAHGS